MIKIKRPWSPKTIKNPLGDGCLYTYLCGEYIVVCPHCHNDLEIFVDGSKDKSHCYTARWKPDHFSCGITDDEFIDWYRMDPFYEHILSFAEEFIL